MPNPSKFAVYSVIRENLEKKTKFQKSLDNRDDVGNKSKIDENIILNEETYQENNRHVETSTHQKSLNIDEKLKGSQIVRGALNSLLVLIKETKLNLPDLCSHALQALYDLVQDQDPEAFQNEPDIFFECLYDNLLEMATSDYTDGVKGLTMNWSSISFSTLIAFCVAVGNPKFLLKAISSNVAQNSLLDQCVPHPTILIKLQRCLQSRTLGRSNNDNLSQFLLFFSKDSLIDQYNIKHCISEENLKIQAFRLTTDGRFFYLLISRTLHKIGSGFNGTLKGHSYASSKFLDIYDWIGYCKDMLICKKPSNHGGGLVFAIDTDTLTLKGTVAILKTKKNGNIFSDGTNLLQIFCQKDDSLLIQHVFGEVSHSDCLVKLSNIKFRAFGFAQFEEEILDESKKIQIIESHNSFEPSLPEGKLVSIACGKEFGLICNSIGKVYYYGKSISLGLKSGQCSNMQTNELIVSKNSHITQIAIGHDGFFAILKTDSGGVYFTGIANRGEDGEPIKARRHIRPTKPKKILRMEKFAVVDISCNNGTSAFVTKSGKLFMFGKDTNHCDSNGLVTKLHDQHIIKVCLGKAHCVVLNTKGELFSFGLNNKYQCGHLFKDQQKLAGVHLDSLKMDPEADCSLNMSDCDKDSQLITSLPPQRVIFPNSDPITQIACGSYHTVALTSKDGQNNVYTFGSNQYGQLGTGDLYPHIGPVHVDFPEIIIQIAAGQNHTVARSKVGNVYSFGNYKKGQLGRSPENCNNSDTFKSIQCDIKDNLKQSKIPQNETSAKKNCFWNCVPEIIKNLGPKFGKRVTWVSTSGDQTFLGLDEVLINAEMLNKMTITADSKTILLLPTFSAKYKAITIERISGICKPHYNDPFESGKRGSSMPIADINNTNMSLLMDPFNDVLCAFDLANQNILIFNILSTVIKKNFCDSTVLQSILSSEIALPVNTDISVTRIQVILSLLYAFDVMTSYPSNVSNNGIIDENETSWIKSKMPAVSTAFTNLLTKESFDSLMVILNWSWNFLIALIDAPDDEETVKNKNHAVYLCKVTIRLLKKITNKIYPSEIDENFTKFKKNAKSSENDKTSSGENLDCNSTETIEQRLVKSNKKNRQENLQLAECVLDFRSMMINILTENIPMMKQSDDCNFILDVLEEASGAFVDCFGVFYPTSFLKWNCLCDLLLKIDGGIMHSGLLASVVLGLCAPNLNLVNIFPILTQKTYKPFSSQDDKFPVSNSTNIYRNPILVEKMMHRKQKEIKTSLSHSWGMKEILVRILNITSRPVRLGIENIYHNQKNNISDFKRTLNHKLIENCCQLLIKMMSEIILQNGTFEFEMCPTTTNTYMYNSGNRFTKCDFNTKAWNPGNFTPDAIAFSADTGISIAGISVFSGTGSYKYQLELLSSNQHSKYQTQQKWELLETITGSYGPEMVQNDMVEIKFMRNIRIKENTKYAIRYCSKGAKTCSGECGSSVIRTPCGVTLKFYSCDLSFNGTTASRGQIPCIIFHRPSVTQEIPAENSKEVHSKQIAMQITTDITKRCVDLLKFARHALSTHTHYINSSQHIDAEHNITPVEEHFHIDWDHATDLSSKNSLKYPNSAQKLTKKIESFSKGIIETLKLDKKSTNPFNIEVDVGAKEIEENISQINGNLKIEEETSASKQNPSHEHEVSYKKKKIVELFASKDACLFHLLPYIYEVMVPILNDTKISVQIMMLIKDLLPQIVSLKHESSGLKKDKLIENKTPDCCVVESDHPYKSGSITTYTVEFSTDVKWMSIEFSPQCGTSQAEDYLKLSIQKGASTNTNCQTNNKKPNISIEHKQMDSVDKKQNLCLVKKFNSPSNWCSNAILLPGNKLELSLETASNYLKYPKSNRYGFKCTILGYDYENEVNCFNSCLDRIENELAFLGGLCCSNLMKNNNNYIDNKENHQFLESIQKNFGILSKGLFVSSSKLAINSVLDYDLPIELTFEELIEAGETCYR